MEACQCPDSAKRGTIERERDDQGKGNGCGKVNGLPVVGRSNGERSDGAEIELVARDAGREDEEEELFSLSTAATLSDTENPPPYRQENFFLGVIRTPSPAVGGNRESRDAACERDGSMSSSPNALSTPESLQTFQTSMSDSVSSFDISASIGDNASTTTPREDSTASLNSHHFQQQQQQHHHHHQQPQQPPSPRFYLTETDVVVEVPQEEPLDADAHHHVLNFCAEGRIFLQAALELLAERDRHAPVLGRNDPTIFKSGSLKKASLVVNGVWKVKYVEIRRGMLSFYENVSSKHKDHHQHQQKQQQQHHHYRHHHQPHDHNHCSTGRVCELLRKDVPLEASSCSVRAVKFHEKARNFTPTGAIFELNIGGQKRLWMAKTRGDRQLWMQTISNAMVGGSVTRGDSLIGLNNNGLAWTGSNAMALYKSDVRKFRGVHLTLRSAKSRADYITGLKSLAKQQNLKVPVKWVAKQQQETHHKTLSLVTSLSSSASASEVVDVAFREENLELSIDQLWRDLHRDCVTINGELFKGDVGHGPERIVGALMRQILGAMEDKSHSISQRHRSDIPESSALAYARDILLSGNRTRSGGDSFFCVQTLCLNPDLVVIVPNSAAVTEPIQIEVQNDEQDIQSIEKSGWIKTRCKNQRLWIKLFFVLSEGTLSFYESALPRPHRLRGQIVLADSTLSVVRRSFTTTTTTTTAEGNNPCCCDEFTLKLTREVVSTSISRERLLQFTSQDRLVDWMYALECAAKIQTLQSVCQLNAKKPLRQLKLSSTLKGGGQHEHLNVEGSIPSSTPKIDALTWAEQATKELAYSVGLSEELVENRIALFSKRAVSSMVVSIRAGTEYKICTVDPTGEESVDTWATIRAHFMQSFRLRGGANGRILRGEEIVRVSVSDCIGDDAAIPSSEPAVSDPHLSVMNVDKGNVLLQQVSTSTSPNRRVQKNRIFRRFSISDEVDDCLRSPPSIDV